MDRLMGILAVGLAVTSTGTVRAQEEQPFGLVPPSWFEESAEISNSLEDPSRPHPELPQRLIYEEDLVQSNRYMFGVAYDQVNHNELYVVFDDGEIQKQVTDGGQVLWSLSTNVRIETFTTSRNGKFLGVGTLSGRFLLIDGTSGAIVAESDEICRAMCRSIAFSPAGGPLLLGDINGYITAVELQGLNPIWQKQLHNLPVHYLKFLDEGGNRFFVSSDSTTVALYNLDRDTEVQRFSESPGEQLYKNYWATNLDQVAGTNYFIIGGYYNVELLDAVDGSAVATYAGSDNSFLMATANTDATEITAISRNHVVYRWDLESAELLSTAWMKPQLMMTNAFDVAVSPQGNDIAVATLEPVFGFPPRIYNRVRVFLQP